MGLQEAQLNSKRKYVDALVESLDPHISENGDAELSVRRLKHVLDDPSPRLQGVFNTLGIERRDALTIIDMLDNEQSGKINLESFICSCIQFRGHAKAVQVEKLCNVTMLVSKRLRKVQQELEAVKTATCNLETAEPGPERETSFFSGSSPERTTSAPVMQI